MSLQSLSPCSLIFLISYLSFRSTNIFLSFSPVSPALVSSELPPPVRLIPGVLCLTVLWIHVRIAAHQALISSLYSLFHLSTLDLISQPNTSPIHSQCLLLPCPRTCTHLLARKMFTRYHRLSQSCHFIDDVIDLYITFVFSNTCTSKYVSLLNDIQGKSKYMYMCTMNTICYFVCCISNGI